MSLTTAPESLFWYWISERHAIYLRRAAGLPKPWTTDPILQQYKFTNPFRENDRGTVWLRENFIEKFNHCPECDDAGCDYCHRHLSCLAANICWYRMYNWWGTGALLGWTAGWCEEMICEKLNAARARGEQVFTGAHIVYSTPGVGKIEAITHVCKNLWNLVDTLEFYELCRNGKSLQRVFEELKTVHCVGGFMAYEMVSDMRHTRLLEDATDIYTWANPGPGAKRGLQRLGLPSSPDGDAIASMRGLLSRAHWDESVFKVVRWKEGYAERLYRVGSTDSSDTAPVFEMRDIEHSLCEFDKYCRVKFGEGKPRSMYPGVAE